MVLNLLFAAFLLMLNLCGFAVAFAWRYRCTVHEQKKTIHALQATIRGYQNVPDWQDLFDDVRI